MLNVEDYSMVGNGRQAYLAALWLDVLDNQEVVRAA